MSCCEPGAASLAAAHARCSPGALAVKPVCSVVRLLAADPPRVALVHYSSSLQQQQQSPMATYSSSQARLAPNCSQHSSIHSLLCNWATVHAQSHSYLLRDHVMPP